MRAGTLAAKRLEPRSPLVVQISGAELFAQNCFLPVNPPELPGDGDAQVRVEIPGTQANGDAQQDQRGKEVDGMADSVIKAVRHQFPGFGLGSKRPSQLQLGHKP